MMWRPTNSFRSRRLLAIKKWPLLVLLAVAFISFMSVAVPKTSYAGTGPHNVLQLVGEKCHDREKLNYDFPNINDNSPGDNHGSIPEGYSSRCSYEGDSDNDPTAPGWEQNLQRHLACSDLFYSHDFQDDPSDNTVTKTLWYTSIGEFKSCWLKAKAMQERTVDTSNNGPCHDMKKGSDNWNDCQKNQEHLHWAIGCDDKMFQSTGDDHWDIKPGAAKDCAERIKNIGNMTIKIIGPDGKVIDSEPIKSAAVKSTEDAASIAGNADSNELGCDGSSNPLSWVICPIINDMLVPAIQKTDSLITEQLSIPTGNMFCSKGSSNNDPCQSYYTAWASFRNIALGLMVIVALTIVIAQAIGMEVLDAYTVRKMLPRVLVAAIGITLSWSLMNFAVTLANDLGFGVRNLMLAPFNNLSSTIQFETSGSDFLNTLFGGIGVLGGLVAWMVTGGPAIVLSYLATAGLAVLIAIFVLILRQIVITLLILLAPIAFIAYVLPNTNRFFKLWWESFSRALLMFPLIIGMITAGRIFAAISLSSDTTGADGLIHGLIGFIAYFAPYFMIPLTFRLSGTMMSGLGNAIQQRAQGGFNFLGQARANSRKDRVARMRSGGLYRGANPFTRFMNTLGDYTVDADENLAYDFGTQNRLGAIGRGKYNPLGYAGRKLIGGTGRDLAEQIAHATTEHTQNAAKKANIHHSTAKAMLGFLGDDEGELGKDLTSRGRERLRTMYPEIRDRDGNVIGRSNIPKNGDTEGLVKLGEFLSNPENTYDLSDARYAGGELVEKAGTLSRFGLDMETKRATQAGVAGLVVAAEGKISPRQNARIREMTEAGARPGSVEAIVAADLHTQREQAATQQRHSLRRGYGTMPAGESGEYVSVLSDMPVSTAAGVIPAYQSDKASAALLTLREDAASASKGEVWDDIKQAAAYHGGTKWREAKAELQRAEFLPDVDPTKAQRIERAQAEFDKANEIRHTVAKAIGTWGRADPGGKAKANEVARAMGLDDRDIAEASGFLGGADAATRRAEAPPEEEG